MDDALRDITALFLASDLAQEVRNIYFEQTGYGIDAGQATHAIFERFRDLIDDANEGPVILLALAALQLQENRLLDPIRDAALSIIDDGSAAIAWRQADSISIKRRTLALRALADLLRQ